MASIQEQLESLVLSATEVKGLTNWPDAMVEDYLNIIRNLIIIASSTDINVNQIVQNTQDIAQNASDIAANAANIDQNSADIAANAANISQNSSDIAANTSDIGDLQTDKADKITGGTDDAIVIQDAAGNIDDSTVLISDLVPIVGAGSPEGVVTSNQSLQFIDNTAAAETLYFNTQVGVNTGWIAV